MGNGGVDTIKSWVLVWVLYTGIVHATPLAYVIRQCTFSAAFLTAFIAAFLVLVPLRFSVDPKIGT